MEVIAQVATVVSAVCAVITLAIALRAIRKS